MRRISTTFLFLVLLLLIAAGTLASFWLGLVPQRLSPFAPLSLSEPAQWFLDPRLAALRRDRTLCRAVLRTPHIEATAVDDKPLRDRCGWTNAVKVSEAGGAELPVDAITCEVAAALALWIEHEVQPAALTAFGERVARIEHMGTYSCRNIVGSMMWKDLRSQHATANAIDIAGFTLASGREVSVLNGWNAKGPEAAFLRDVHAKACRYFRVAIGPEHNKSHKDHFHYDRGVMRTCR